MHLIIRLSKFFTLLLGAGFMQQSYAQSTDPDRPSAVTAQTLELARVFGSPGLSGPAPRATKLRHAFDTLVHAPATVAAVTESQALEGDCAWVWCTGLIGPEGSRMGHGGGFTSADSLLRRVQGLRSSLLSSGGRTSSVSPIRIDARPKSHFVNGRRRDIFSSFSGLLSAQMISRTQPKHPNLCGL